MKNTSSSLYARIKENVTLYHLLALLELYDEARIKLPDPFGLGLDGFPFSIAPSGTYWFLFAEEREHGNVIEFWAKYKGISVREAARQLEEMFLVSKSLDVETHFIQNRIDGLRALIGADRPDVETYFVQCLKESYANGKEAANWSNRFGRNLLELLRAVYDRAVKKRNGEEA